MGSTYFAYPTDGQQYTWNEDAQSWGFSNSIKNKIWLLLNLQVPGKI